METNSNQFKPLQRGDTRNWSETKVITLAGLVQRAVYSSIKLGAHRQRCCSVRRRRSETGKHLQEVRLAVIQQTSADKETGAVSGPPHITQQHLVMQHLINAQEFFPSPRLAGTAVVCVFVGIWWVTRVGIIHCGEPIRSHW